MSGWVNLTAAARLLGRTKSTTLRHACNGRIRTIGGGYETEYSVEDVERLRAELSVQPKSRALMRWQEILRARTAVGAGRFGGFSAESATRAR